MKPKYILGRKDKADFPELKLRNLDIKIDTGAFTSSIHCHQIEEIENEGGKVLHFQLLDPSHSKYNNLEFKLNDYSCKIIKNSFGESQERYVINTTIILYGQSFPLALSLSERGDMKYPVLIGRELLKRSFIIDPNRINLSYKHKKRNRKKSK
ncbi:ATP-dependent zinc protease [Bacteroidota bacterium]